MERLKDYCLNACIVDGLQTFVISPAKYDALIKDSNLLNDLQRTDKDIHVYKTASKNIFSKESIQLSI